MFDVPARDAQEVAFEQSERAYADWDRLERGMRIGAGHTLPWRCEFYEAEWDEFDPPGGSFWYGYDWPEETYSEWWRWWSRHWRMYQPIGA